MYGITYGELLEVEREIMREEIRQEARQEARQEGITKTYNTLTEVGVSSKDAITRTAVSWNISEQEVKRCLSNNS